MALTKEKAKSTTEKQVGLFDIINDLSYGKKNLIRDDQNSLVQEHVKTYNPFMVNRAFSYHVSSIHDAQLMNQCAGLDKDMQHDYYLYSLRKDKRYSKWYKNQNSKNEDLQLLSEIFDTSIDRAVENRRLFSDEQMENIRERYSNKGGIQHERRTDKNK